MGKKPAYADLEQKIKALEKKAAEQKQIEKALQDSEEKYRLLIENFSDPIWVFGRDGITLVVNSPGAERLGGKPEDYLGKTVHDILPDDADVLMERNRQVFETGEGANYEDLFDLPLGKIWTWSNLQPLKDINGKTDAVQIISYDITERKQAEEALKESVGYFQLHSDLANTLIKIPPGEFDKTIEHFLTRMVELFDVDRSALMYWPEGYASAPNIYSRNREGIKPYQRMDDYDKYLFLAEKLRNGEVFSFSNIDDLPPEAQNEKNYYVNEGTKSAIRIPMIVEGRMLGALMFDSCRSEKAWPDDLVQQLQLIGQTFSYSLERKLAEEALRDSEDKLRAIFENVNDGIIFLDNQGTIIDTNKEVDIFGFRREEVIGKNFAEFEFYRPDSFENLMERFSEIFTGSHSNLIELEGKRRNGVEIIFEVSTNLIEKDGEVKNIVVAIRDITERKKLEAQLQQAQRMEAIGTLAGGIAHDFNNLLMGVQGRTSMMLMDTKSSHPNFEHLKGIETYVKNAADLTKQLLGFARGGKYEVKPIDLNELIEEQNQMFGRTKKEITIRGKYEKNLWTAEVDPGQIRQVLLNLYVNAWQAMPGGGDLYIQTENVILDKTYVKPFQVKSGKYIKLSVTDTGAGMDEATRQRIFHPFFTTKEMGRGTGLGLASAYGIIKNHSGFINVYSEKGQGTVFTIYLPSSEKEVKKDEELSERVLRGTETILLVDDEEMIAEVGEEVLKKLGYQVLCAKSGIEAIEIYKTNKDRIALVILDMIMPNMGGGETYDQLKEINPGIKALLSTGYSLNGRASEILKRGCDGFIQKPFNIVELSQKIREVLEV